MRVLLFVLLSWLGTSALLYTNFLQEDPGYHNTITSINEITTGTGMKVFITFEDSDPICMYAPANFAESLDDTVYRVFMPRTCVDQDVITSLDMQEFDEGVELVLEGKSIQKFVGGDKVLFVLTK